MTKLMIGMRYFVAGTYKLFNQQLWVPDNHQYKDGKCTDLCQPGYGGPTCQPCGINEYGVDGKTAKHVHWQHQLMAKPWVLWVEWEVQIVLFVRTVNQGLESVSISVVVNCMTNGTRSVWRLVKKATPTNTIRGWWIIWMTSTYPKS